MTSVSRVPHPKRYDDSASLSRQQVVDAAFDYIDSFGLGALTMRGLAKEIGVYPSAIYWHAGNKTQLIALLYARVLEDVVLPDVEGMRWDDWIRQVARQARKALQPHPELAAGFLASLPLSPDSLRLADRFLHALARAGFAGEDLVHAYNHTLAGIFGWIAEEFAADPGESDEDWRDQFESILRKSGDEEFVQIKSALPHLANHAWLLRWTTGPGAPLDSGFEYMLESLVAGLKVMVARGAAVG